MRPSSYAIGVLISGLVIMVAVIVVSQRYTGTIPPVRVSPSPGGRAGQMARPSVDPLLMTAPLQKGLEGVTPEVYLTEETGTTVPVYEITEFTVRAGQVVSLIFRNRSTVGHRHDWLLVEPGKVQEVDGAARAAGPDRFWIPDSKYLLAFVLLTEPGASRNIVFRAPQQPGDYPFFCSFPGHVLTMNGVLHVKGDGP